VPPAAEGASRDRAVVRAAPVLGQQGHRPAGGVVAQAQRVAAEFAADTGVGEAAGRTRPSGAGRITEAAGLVGPEVKPDPVLKGVGLGAGDPSDRGDGQPAGHHENGLEAPKGAHFRGPLEGARQALPVVLVEAKFMGCSCSSHRSSLPRRAILWKTFGYLLRALAWGV
jgi:hypothetical protein